MGVDKEEAIVQGQIHSDSETGERHASALGEIGYVPKDHRETDFFTRNGLNLRSFQRREFAR